MHRAIAMIELIFAIVIMGIVMMSAPMLIDRSVQSSYTALQQESVAAAATQISMIMTEEWDHEDTNSSRGTPVLQTGGTIPNCTTDYPVGVTSTSGRYCKDALATNSIFPAASTLGSDGTDGGGYNDIDDFNNRPYSIHIYNDEEFTTFQGDYLDRNITISSETSYGDDQPRLTDGTATTYDKNTAFSNPFTNKITANTTNIKLITVILTSTNPVDEIKDKEIRLSAFMCNIGAPKPKLVNNDPHP